MYSRAPTTKGDTKKKNRFFSLKWQILIAVSMILIIINGFITLITYNNLNEQFIAQQSQLMSFQKKESEKMTQQVFQRLEDFGEILSLLSSTNSAKGSIKDSLDQHWGHIQLLFELRSAKLLNMQKETLGEWGENFSRTIDAMVQQAIDEQRPAKQFICNLDCQFFMAAPVLDKQGETFILIVSHSIADWLIHIKDSTGADTGVISVRQGFSTNAEPEFSERLLPNWNSHIIGLTNAATNYDYLAELSKYITIKDAESQNNYIIKNTKNLNILFLPLKVQDLVNPAYLVLINDISSTRQKVDSGVIKAIIISISGVLITALFMLLSMWYPIKHLTTLSTTLPLLATGNFSQVKKSLIKRNSSQGVEDELDILDNATIQLTQQLESLEREVKIREKALTKNALYDELTGLANRRLFMDRISVALKNLVRDKSKFGVLFLDLDQFKRINDSLGHDQGDHLLLEVAKRLSYCVRESDTVARLGGDEFTILLNNLEDNHDATNVALKILNSLRTPVLLEGKEVIVTTSIGIAIAPENGKEPETILRNADLAMYKAKGKGRDNYHYYTISMNADAKELLALENDLRNAVEMREFELYYQPQIDLKSGIILGAEALLRWNSPKRGFVAPYLFIDALEDTGLIVPLGEQIMEMACEQAKTWNQLNIGDIKVAVNLSARQFKEPLLTQFITETLENIKLNSRFLELEITESMLMDDIQVTIERLQELKLLGLTLSIDDFGTGYSSLSYLKQFPVNILKVDREFVKDIPHNKSDMAISSAVIAMAHKLNLRVVAEGIETKEQLKFLQKNDCEIGQGYYFGKPMPVDEMTELLLKQTPFEVNN
jgi:diguanylate cyclase (GGDEF)-like protein